MSTDSIWRWTPIRCLFQIQMKRKDRNDDDSEPARKWPKTVDGRTAMVQVLSNRRLVGSKIAQFLRTSETVKFMQSCKLQYVNLRDNQAAFKEYFCVPNAALIPSEDDNPKHFAAFCAKIPYEMEYIDIVTGPIPNGSSCDFSLQIIRVLTIIAKQAPTIHTISLFHSPAAYRSMDPKIEKKEIAIDCSLLPPFKLTRLIPYTYIVFENQSYLLAHGVSQLAINWWNFDHHSHQDLVGDVQIKQLDIVVCHPVKWSYADGLDFWNRCECDLPLTWCLSHRSYRFRSVEHLVLTYRDAYIGETDNNHLSMQTLHGIFHNCKRVSIYRAGKRPSAWIDADIKYLQQAHLSHIALRVFD
jgi:hypothetical protein